MSDESELSVVSFHLSADCVDVVRTDAPSAPPAGAQPPPLTSTLSMVDVNHQIANPQVLTFTNLTKQLDTSQCQSGASSVGLFDLIGSGGAHAPTSTGGPRYRTLLNNVSGCVKPGQICAVMGPSGSGKTTLLNCICNRTSSLQTGDVCLNGEKWNKGFKRKIAYVLQQDLFFEHLSVRDQLTYTALLRLPRYMTRAQKLVQVESTIDSLGLSKCANTPIMFLSGGERKRVNIATELLNDPAVVVLDEPCSGLDAHGATQLINTLRALASQGRTVITSIHQPNSQAFHSFDILLLLCDGEVVYSGKPSGVVAYFEQQGFPYPSQYNAADYLMDVVSGGAEVKAKLIDFYKKSPSDSTVNTTSFVPHAKQRSAHDLLVPVDESRSLLDEPKWPTTFLEQFVILYTRQIGKTYGEIFTRLNWYQCICLAIICGLCWFDLPMTEKSIQDKSAFCYFVMTFWPMHTMFTSMLSFPRELMVMNKERSSGSYRLSSFFLAKGAAEAPLRLVQPTVFLIIAYWMSRVNMSFAQFLGFLISELLCVLAAESIGLFLGASIPDLMKCMTVATIGLLGLMLVGGFFIQTLPIWLHWAKYLSIFKFAFDAVLQFEWGGSYSYYCDGSGFLPACTADVKGNSTMGGYNALGQTFTGADALDYVGTQGSIGFNLGILILFWVVFRIGAYLSLRFFRDKTGRQ